MGGIWVELHYLYIILKPIILMTKIENENPMQSTVLHATSELANNIARDLMLLESKKRPGEPLLRREETEDGFRLLAGKKSAPIVVFQWSDKGPGLRKIDYDTRLVKIS